MKNKSFSNSFPRVGDKAFDRNKDGKLGALETWARDSQIAHDEK